MAACLALLLTSDLLPAANTWHAGTPGTDDGAGTPTEPFATVQHAVDIAEPGDVVRVGRASSASA
ncbi:MAG: hypothetical protein WD342_05525 [Verrucomicrobiales bacterium]